jgi:ABC-type polysaccharide/polyol phosphate export permease
MIKSSFQIAWKAIIELVREKWVLLIIFLFPVLMIGLYKIAYSDNGQGFSNQMKIGIVNQVQQQNNLPAYDQKFITYLTAETYESLPVYSIKKFSTLDIAYTALYERQIIALLILKPTFNQDIRNSSVSADIDIVGNTYSSQFVFMQTFLSGSLEQFNTQLLHDSGVSQSQNILINYEFLEGSGGLSDLDFGLPGIIVFGLMFLTMSTAQILVREKSNQTFLRYRLSNVKPASIFSGIMASQILIALLLMPFILLSCMLMGVHIRGNIAALMIIGCILSISAVGIGLIVACFTKNESEAINIGASIVVPLILMSNSLYPMKKTTMFELFGQNISFYDFLPTSVASDLLRGTLIYSQSLAQNQFWLIILTLQALTIFIIGAGLFNHFLYRTLSA